MAKTIKEYRKILEDEFLYRLGLEGWENLVDNLIDYDSLPAPDEEGDVAEDNRRLEARDEEERKAAIALREFLVDIIEDYASLEFYKYTREEELGL